MNHIMLVSWSSPLKRTRKRGSGNIVYNKLSQTQECGATNQIAPFCNIFTYWAIPVYKGTPPWRSNVDLPPPKSLIIRLLPSRTNYRLDLNPQDSLKYGNSPPEFITLRHTPQISLKNRFYPSRFHKKAIFTPQESIKMPLFYAP